MFAKEVMDILSNSPLYTMMINPTNAVVHMPKDVIVGQTAIRLFTIVNPEVDNQ